MALTILCISFFGFLVLGVPVAFAIGLSSLCTILYEGLPLAVLFQQMMSGMNVFSFLAIPFFVFSGELMLHGGVADKIVRLAQSAAGHVRGGLGMSNVVACTLFGGVCGSAVADVSAMGAVMIPMMKKEGYHADYAVNVTTHAALVGALMPTSHRGHLMLAAAKAVKTTGVVLLLIGVSAMFQYLMGLYEVADFMGGVIAELSTTPWVVFLLINVILFILGTFMDMAATILIATPIFLPIAMKYGMDPVQFGMVMLINCALGLNTPPVGTTQFVGCAIGGISVGQVMKTIWPFYGALIAALLLVTYVPAFSLALPRLLMGYAH